MWLQGRVEMRVMVESEREINRFLGRRGESWGKERKEVKGGK